MATLTAKGYDPKVTPWRIDPQEFSRKAGARPQIEFLLRYAILAPSSHNTQPWRFRISGTEVGIHADLSRWLRVADPDQRELHLSLGCALENLLIAAEHFGFAHRVRYDPSGGPEGPVATVVLTRGGTPSSFRGPELFGTIGIRKTNHRAYDPRLLPPEVIGRLAACRVEEGLGLHLASDAEIKRKVRGLVVHADAAQFADAAFREELGHWIGQGVFGTPWLLAKMGQLAVTYLDRGKTTARRDTEVLLSAPVLGLISSRENDRASQLRAGQLFERIYLTATHLGLGLQPVSQILQLPETKAAVARLLPEAGRYPQQPFRLGFAKPETQHTPRRPLDELLS